MLARPLARPLCRPLASPLTGAAGGLDADAVARIAQITTAKGSVPTAGQQAAIDSFIRGEKLASRWTGHKRIYLPIWANAAANAIDLVTGAVGSFNGTVTHGAGYVQGDGSTGYFNLGVSPASIGQTQSAGGMGFLCAGGGTGTANSSLGVQTSGSSIAMLRWYDTLGIDYAFTSFDASFVREGAAPITTNHGIISGQSFGGGHRLTRRNTAGNTVLGSNSNAGTTEIPTHNYYLMGLNNAGSFVPGSDLRYGAAFLNLGFSDANNDAFTAALKTLWETCTGLTLP